MSRRVVAAIAGSSFMLAATVARAQFGPQRFPQQLLEPTGFEPNIVGMQVATYVGAIVAGFLLGLLFSPKFRSIRRYVGMGLGVLLFLLSFSAPLPVNLILTLLVAFILFCMMYGIGAALGALAGARSTTFGSARWATLEGLEANGRIGEKGLVLGYFPGREHLVPLHYQGDRHLLSVAPTRSGKGVSSIIPNLLTYPGSALVIDPKGENAVISGLRRGAGDAARGIRGLGQKVYIVDPWGITTDLTGIEPACFNPLDWLDSESPDIGENAMMLADALVVPTAGNRDPFWDEEAKALLMGFILHVAISPEEEHNRTLGRVRDLLMLPTLEFTELCLRMAKSDQPIVASTGARTASKDPKLLSSVLTSAQSHTHFLDSPRLRASLSWSDFRFEDLKRAPTTVYLVLPADRLNTFGRWLRLLVQQAITVTARNIAERPEKPILFMLDEMPALGRLAMVEQAYGLMAGFGMQLWGIVQDLAQLKRIYDDGWETFIGNSGVLQYFGSRDQMTADYFSALCGETTVPTLSSTITRVFAKESSSSVSENRGETQRKLVMPDELMRMGDSVQLILVENEDAIAGRKIRWFTDDRFRPHGVDLRRLAAAPEPTPAPSAPPPEAGPAPPPASEPSAATAELVAALAITDFAAAVAFLERRGCQARRGGWGITVEVRFSGGAVRTFPNEAAFIAWLRAEHAREAA